MTDREVMLQLISCKTRIRSRIFQKVQNVKLTTNIQKFYGNATSVFKREQKTNGTQN